MLSFNKNIVLLITIMLTITTLHGTKARYRKNLQEAERIQQIINDQKKALHKEVFKNKLIDSSIRAIAIGALAITTLPTAYNKIHHIIRPTCPPLHHPITGNEWWPFCKTKDACCAVIQHAHKDHPYNYPKNSFFLINRAHTKEEIETEMHKWRANNHFTIPISGCSYTHIQDYKVECDYFTESCFPIVVSNFADLDKQYKDFKKHYEAQHTPTIFDNDANQEIEKFADKLIVENKNLEEK